MCIRLMITLLTGSCCCPTLQQDAMPYFFSVSIKFFKIAWNKWTLVSYHSNTTMRNHKWIPHWRNLHFNAHPVSSWFHSSGTTSAAIYSWSLSFKQPTGWCQQRKKEISGIRTSRTMRYNFIIGNKNSKKPWLDIN